MSGRGKISNAFDAFMAGSRSSDKRDAIVVYRSPRDENVPAPSMGPTERLNYLKTRVACQRAVREAVVEVYQREGPRRQPRGRSVELSASPVGSDVLPVSLVEVTTNTLPVLADQPDVVAILPNQKIHPITPMSVDYKAASKNESKGGLTWGLQVLGVPELWQTTQGEQINVAVLDTGVHGGHPCLSGRVQRFLVVDPLGRRIEASPSFDGGQHGTHVCGTIAGGQADGGVSIGVAPHANLLVAGVLIGNATLMTLLEGMSWAIENGAHIINMSLGMPYYEPRFVEVFQSLIDDWDILPVVSVGNENHGNTSSPGNAANALSVGAVRKASHGSVWVAPFSGGASLVFPGQDDPLVTKPDVVAPGVGVYSCIPAEQGPQGGVFEYNYMDGSSMASPHVAGVAALLMAAQRNARASDIATALKETAWHPDGKDGRPDNRWGYGMIQPKEALRALSS